MECWIHDQRPVNGEISSFAERQAVLKAQVVGSFASGLESCAHFEQQFWPCDQLPVKQNEGYGAGNNSTPVSSWGVDGSFSFGACNVNEEELQQCELEFDRLPIQMHGCGNFQFLPMPVFQDEDYGHAELNLPAWQTQPSLSEVCCREASAERPRNSSFYTLDDVMKKLPRVAPLLPPSPSMNIGIPPSPQFSSDLCLSSCSRFSARVSFPPSLLHPSEAETEHLNQLRQLQSYCKPPYSSVEPLSVAARNRRYKIREKIQSLEKLIPQGSKLDTARMLDEAIKYLKFLQAQVQVLETMPQADSKPNPNSADDNVNICVKSNSNGDGTRKLDLTNASALHRSASPSASSKNQMLHSLLSSSRIQKKLFSAGKIIVTVQQKEALASTWLDLSGDLSNF